MSMPTRTHESLAALLIVVGFACVLWFVVAVVRQTRVLQQAMAEGERPRWGRLIRPGLPDVSAALLLSTGMFVSVSGLPRVTDATGADLAVAALLTAISTSVFFQLRVLAAAVIAARGAMASRDSAHPDQSHSVDGCTRP